MNSFFCTYTDETTLTSNIVNADKARFNELVTQGKEKTRQGDLHGALELYQAAYKIHKSQKLANRIQKLKVNVMSIGIHYKSLLYIVGWYTWIRVRSFLSHLRGQRT